MEKPSERINEYIDYQEMNTADILDDIIKEETIEELKESIKNWMKMSKQY